MAQDLHHTRLIEEAYWLVLGRGPSALERADETAGVLNADQASMRRGILASDEFRRLRAAWQRGQETHEPAPLEAGLEKLGPPEYFVKRAYEILLGREPDESGATHYAGVLAKGEPRAAIARALALSDEFEQRLRAVPRDTQLCELANPAKWQNPEWLDLLRSLGLSDDPLAMHRKPYEFTQLLFGCQRLGMLRPDASIVSIGAGHEQVLYWLANHVQRVVATDMYEGAWTDVLAREGDPAVLDDPDRYAPFPYRRECLEFRRMDGRQLEFPDGTFDVSYSLSSIEHFGGFEGAARTMREMARVLKPGGILALATEYVLSGPPCAETFQPEEIHALVRESGLTLVESIDEQVYRRYNVRPVRIQLNPFQSPHMTVQIDNTVFTSVMIFLRK
ncbi:MAG: methyltransferase domain-containing protein [Vicinamibacterales bacterium]